MAPSRNMRVHYNFYPGRSADGMSIDTQGNLYASAGMKQLRGTSETLDTKTGIYVISPGGKLLKFIPIPGGLHHEQRVRRSGHEDAVRDRRQDLSTRCERTSPAFRADHRKLDLRPGREHSDSDQGG